MPDEPGRTPREMQLVREIAAKVGDLGRPMYRFGIKSFHPAESRGPFDELLARVEAAVTGGRPFLGDERRQRLAASFANSLRIFAFYERLDAPFVLALTDVRNVYDAGIVIDIFSRRALDGLGLDERWTPPPPDRPDAWPGARPVIDRLREHKEAVKTVGRDAAALGFTTLFVDTLRAAAQNPPPQLGVTTSATTALFTVHSGPKNNGYQLSVFPQYRYSPVVFGGSQLSTPVSDQLATGHWCFEGRTSGMARPIRDPGVHFAGPSNTSTTTTAF